MDTQTIRKRRERRHELEKRNSSLRIDSVWDMCWFQSGNLNRGCCMTVKSHELRATDARAFIKNRVGEDPPPSSFKREQPSSAHNGRLLRATGPHSLSLSLSLSLSPIYGDPIRAMTNVLRNTASIRPSCRAASRRDATRRVDPHRRATPSITDNCDSLGFANYARSYLIIFGDIDETVNGDRSKYHTTNGNIKM